MIPINYLETNYQFVVTTPTEASSGSELSKPGEPIDIVAVPVLEIANNNPSPNNILHYTNAIALVFIVLILITFIVHVMISFFRLPN